jgi:transposase-like protein
MSTKRSRRKHSADIKFKVVLESLQKDKHAADIARAYGIDQNLVSKWKREFLERGREIFECPAHNESEKRVNDLEHIIGQQTVEIQLLKKFLGHYSSR